MQIIYSTIWHTWKTSSKLLEHFDAFDFTRWIQIVDTFDIWLLEKTHLDLIRRQLAQVQVRLAFAHIHFTLDVLHIANASQEFFNSFNDIYMRVVQVQWHWPVEEHIFGAKEIDSVELVEWTEDAEWFVDVIVGRQRATGKVKANFVFRPWFWYVKVKLPNSMIEIGFDGLVKLGELEEKKFISLFFALHVSTIIIKSIVTWQRVRS